MRKTTTSARGATLLILVALMAAGPLPAGASDALMTSLPAYSKYRCANCHTSSTPTAQNATLNVFGTDFKNNGLVWNPALALLNSDGDRCLNGFEIGDYDGDGVFDGAGNVVEHSNPGDASDCTIAVDEATWGVIKDLFGEEIRQYLRPDVEDADSWNEWVRGFSRHFP